VYLAQVLDGTLGLVGVPRGQVRKNLFEYQSLFSATGPACWRSLTTRRSSVGMGITTASCQVMVRG
jgi:hypothetical protein